MDGHDDPALGRAVQFGQEYPRHVDRLAEDLSLGDGVLTGGGVQHQQDLVRGPRNFLGHYITDLCELPHKVCLGVQSPRRVDQQCVDASRQGGVAGIEHHRRRIGPRRALDDINAQPRRPNLQLLDGRGAERVRGPQQDAAPLVDERLGNLGDARCLA